MFRRYKNAHFRCNYLFLENGPFLCPFQVTKHYNNRGFSRHRGKPKMALLVVKVPLWEGAWKGALLFVIPKSCVPLEKQEEFTKMGGGVCQHARRCFLFVFLSFGGFVSLCVFYFLCLEKKKKPKVISCNFRVFFFFCPQKSFFSSYSVFFFWCSFCLPFQNFIFLWFCPSTPIWKTLIFLFFYLSLAFSFLNVCLFLSNKLS